MAAEPQAEASLSWPLPPMQYVKNYTDENVANGLAPPPPPPMCDEMFSMFGRPFHPNDSIIRSLESQNIKRLYPTNYEQKKELRKMNHSLLANFLDLLDILVKSPDSELRNQKIEDIRLLFINMHHLVNEYRTHQARETIRVMLTVQKKQKTEIAEKFQKQLDKISESLQQSLASLNKPRVHPVIKPEPMDTEEQTIGTGTTDNEAITIATTDSKDRLMCELIDQS